MTEWFLAERHHAIKLSQRLRSAISRLETIKETNPEICLDEDLAYYKSVELVKPPKGWDEKRPLCKSDIPDMTDGSVNQWQPIETAPKDGTNILGYMRAYNDDIIVVCHFEDEDGKNEYCPWLESEGELYARYELTHWMSLPEPPKDGE